MLDPDLVEKSVKQLLVKENHGKKVKLMLDVV